jgi:3-hydroxy-9,10-secoandrosta-1,3,5(10)-triene-9,17-dione monooxygenase reductase component
MAKAEPRLELVDDRAVDPAELRRALGSFVTGVTIVTTRQASDEPVGLTVNSFNSVSLSPPLVLWSLARSAISFETFMTSAHFVVNVLAADQIELSERFAKSGGDKFAGVRYREGMGGLPLLEGAAAHFTCRSAYRHGAGDHVIIIGEVLAHKHSEREPLVYARGRYVEIGKNPSTRGE